MPCWDQCYSPNQERGRKGSFFRLLIMTFYCSLERLLANHNTSARTKPRLPSAVPRVRAELPHSTASTGAERALPVLPRACGWEPKSFYSLSGLCL